MKILTLNGCSVCDKFKDLLNRANLSYNEISCTGESKVCDEVEEYANCDLYPICILSISGNQKVTLCLTSDYSKINTIVDANSHGKIIYFHSINTMFDFIKKV